MRWRRDFASVKIIVAGPSLSPKLARLYRSAIASSPYYSRRAKRTELKRFSLRHVRDGLKHRDNLFLAAVEKNSVIGAVNGTFEAGLFWIDWIVVGSSHRGQGVATALLQSLESRLQRRRIHKVWCDSRTTNMESKALLAKHGYSRIATIRNHWYGQDFILWQKLLSGR